MPQIFFVVYCWVDAMQSQFRMWDPGGTNFSKNFRMRNPPQPLFLLRPLLLNVSRRSESEFRFSDFCRLRDSYRLRATAVFKFFLGVARHSTEWGGKINFREMTSRPLMGRDKIIPKRFRD